MKISYSKFLAAVEANEGRALLTAGGKRRFTVRCTAQGVEVTPASSGFPRWIPRSAIERYIDHYNRTGSTRPLDRAKDFNHSYVPAILEIITGQRSRTNQRGRAASDEMNAGFSVGAQRGKRAAPIHRPAESAILVRWKDKVSRNYLDIIPLEWFASTVPKRGVTHKVGGRGGREYTAKCDVTVHGLVADLDYEPYALFNFKQGMLLGVARLTFADSDRTALQGAQWKSKGVDEFEDCEFETPQFEGPPESPYTPPSGAAKKKAHMVRERPGQKAFRRNLKLAYGHCCCITGCGVSDALEGAHIDPYKAPASDNVRNGLLLRKDVHALFDEHLIGIEPGTLIIRVASLARSEACYAKLHGAKLKPSAELSYHPDPGALERHWRLFRGDE
jgi:HNH endonuclease